MSKYSVNYIHGCKNRHFKGINLCVEPLYVARVIGAAKVTVMACTCI